MSGRLAIKTEDDFKKKEFADKLASTLFEKVAKVAKEKGWDEKRDFRRILDIIQKEES
jgi:hypothetical protein